jgi:TRAP transporter TAXI family solute receptor
MLVATAASLLPAWRSLAAGAAPDASSAPFVLATSTPGGGFTLYGDMLARVLAERAGHVVVTARMTAGTNENLALLKRGEVDAALIQGTSASEVLAQGSAGPLRILFAMYPSPGLLAVPSDSKLERLDDVVGRTIVFGVRTSGLVTLGRQVFAGIGIDIDRDVRAIYVDRPPNRRSSCWPVAPKGCGAPARAGRAFCGCRKRPAARASSARNPRKSRASSSVTRCH